MDFVERRSQLLRILPPAMRTELFRRIDDFKDLGSIKEWLRKQVELEREWGIDDRARTASKPVNVMEAPEDGEEGDELLDELLAILPGASEEQLLALQSRFGGGNRSGGGNRWRPGGRPGGSGTVARRPPGGPGAPRAGPPNAQATRLPGAPRADEGRCVNCGSQAHTVRECTVPVVAKKDRPCFKCGKPGHFSSRCPGNAKVQLVTQGDDCFEDVPDFCIAVDWTTVSKGVKPSTETQRRAVTVADFVHANVFQALEEAETGTQSEASDGESSTAGDEKNAQSPSGPVAARSRGKAQRKSQR